MNESSDIDLDAMQTPSLAPTSHNSLYTHQSLPLGLLAELKVAGQVLPVQMTRVDNKQTNNSLILKHEISGTFIFEN